MKRMDFSRFPRRHLPRNEALFYEEEESRELFVLLTGELGIFRDEVHVATIDEPLSVVGEISALTGRPRNATVRALVPATLLVIGEPEQLFEEYPQLGTKLARTLAARLEAMNVRFVDLKRTSVRALAIAAKGIAPASADETEPLLGGVPRRVAAAAGEAAAGLPAAEGAGGAAAAGGEPGALDETLAAFSDLLDWDPNVDAGT